MRSDWWNRSILPVVVGDRPACDGARSVLAADPVELHLDRLRTEPTGEDLAVSWRTDRCLDLVLVGNGILALASAAFLVLRPVSLVYLGFGGVVGCPLFRFRRFVTSCPARTNSH